MRELCIIPGWKSLYIQHRGSSKAIIIVVGQHFQLSQYGQSRCAAALSAADALCSHRLCLHLRGFNRSFSLPARRFLLSLEKSRNIRVGRLMNFSCFPPLFQGNKWKKKKSKAYSYTLDQEAPAGIKSQFGLNEQRAHRVGSCSLIPTHLRLLWFYAREISEVKRIPFKTNPFGFLLLIRELHRGTVTCNWGVYWCSLIYLMRLHFYMI